MGALHHSADTHLRLRAPRCADIIVTDVPGPLSEVLLSRTVKELPEIGVGNRDRGRGALLSLVRARAWHGPAGTELRGAWCNRLHDVSR